MSGRERLGPCCSSSALGALLYLPGLGREILRHPLEAKYALAAREMVRGGPWLVAHLFGEIYPDKPPLYFWATAGVAELRGGRLDEVSARLPAVLGGLATLALTLALGEALFGAQGGPDERRGAGHERPLLLVRAAGAPRPVPDRRGDARLSRPLAELHHARGVPAAPPGSRSPTRRWRSA